MRELNCSDSACVGGILTAVSMCLVLEGDEARRVVHKPVSELLWWPSQTVCTSVSNDAGGEGRGGRGKDTGQSCSEKTKAASGLAKPTRAYRHV